MKKENRNRLILLIIIGIFFAVYFFVPSVNREINESIRVLTKVDINGVAEYIRGF